MRTPTRLPHEPTRRTRRPSRWQRMGRSALSAALSLLLLIGLPWLLATTVGNPAAHWPDLVAGDISNPVILAALSCIAWILWAQFTLAFLVEFVSAVRRTPMPARIPAVLASQQWLARALVNGVLLLLPVTISSVAPAGQALAMTAALPAPNAMAGSATTATEPITSSTSAPATTTVTIAAHGERTWWDLAERHLGDGAAWQELWTLNAGRSQPDGTTLRSESVMLRPGWTVLIPAGAESTHSSGAAEPTAAAAPRDVVVRPGDTLSRIAADHGAGTWNELWRANADRGQPDGRTFTDPDLIEPGWVITVPAAAESAGTPGRPAVTVTTGDTLSRIALDHDTTVDELLALNVGVTQADGSSLTDPDNIQVGWRIRLPDPTDTDHSPTDTPPPAQTPEPDPSGNPADAPADAPGPSTDTPATTAPPPADTPDAAAPGSADTPEATAPGATDSSLTPGTAQAQPGTPSAPSDASETSDAGAPAASSALPVAAFAGAGGLLAALTLAALVRHRRRQFRHRRPGHDLSATPDELVAMERAVLTAGSAGTPDARFMEQALHGLAHLADAAGTPPPDVAAAVLTDRALTLLLHTPRVDTLGAWSSNTDGRRWTLLRTEPPGERPDLRDWLAPPYPTLVTVGCTPAGDHWLIDLERAGTLTVTGDRSRALALARFMAAELAHHSWAESVEVTMSGFGAELAALHPDRLTHIPDPAVALARLRRQRQDAADVIRTTRTDVLTGRSRGVAGDGWTSQVLLVAAADGTGEPVEPIKDPAERSTVALVVVGHQAGVSAATGWNLRITADGLLSIPALDVTVIAQQIPEDEASRLAGLLSFAVDHATAADTPKSAGASETGRDDGPADGHDRRSGSLLAEPDSTYLTATATTVEDLQCLAPAVRPQDRQRAEADDTLDADLADWHDPGTARPRINLFGGPEVRAGASRFSAFNTEIAAYLATHPAGVGIDRYACDMWPDEPDVIAHTTVRSKVRTSLSQVRKLLGSDPVTGADYLPRNTGRGATEYRLSPAVLVDTDLFGRLRSRGRARGPEGLPDLHAALELVVGPPLVARRPGGYGWLADTPIDHQLSAAVVDLTHLVATHHLAQGEPELAAAAAQTALRAGTSEDTPLLDLVAACHAQGQVAQADAYIRRIMANHEAAVEEDLPPRTYEVLLRRRWLPPAA